MRNIGIICTAIIGVSILCSPIVAQAKTAKECRAEWQANKAANQAKKITESAYVKRCRPPGGAAAQPAAAPAPAKSTKTEPKMAPAPAAAPAKSSAQPTTPAMAPSGAKQYSTEAQAKARCGSGTVVWANLKSKIYHFAGHRTTGTQRKAHICASVTPQAKACVPPRTRSIPRSNAAVGSQPAGLPHYGNTWWARELCHGVVISITCSVKLH